MKLLGWALIKHDWCPVEEETGTRIPAGGQLHVSVGMAAYKQRKEAWAHSNLILDFWPLQL